MCEFHSGIVLKNKVITDLDTDSHSDLLEKYHIKDDFKEADFVKVELVPVNKPLHEAILTPTDKEWELKVDQSNYPNWWQASEKWAKKEMLKSLKNVIAKRCVLAGKTIKEIKETERWVVVCGTIQDVWGGTIQDVRGGTIQDVRGGTIQDVRGGTIQDVRGGTIHNVWGGTIQDVNGGTIYNVWGGTIHNVRGETIQNVKKYAIVICRVDGVLKIRTGEEYKKIEHTIG